MKSQNIPRGAIYIPLPLIRQPDEYSCGAGSLMSIGCHWSVGPVRIQDYKTALGTNPINGTYHRDIVRYARELGLSARIQTDISRAQLQSIIARRIPVIIAFQAWAPDPVVYDDPNHNKDGHYAVCVGFDRKNNFYFMDPGLTGRYKVLS